MIEPIIKTLTEKKLMGKSLTMSLAGNRTGELWGGFMPRRKEIRDATGADLYSINLFGPTHDFKPQTEFVKWAAVEVNDPAEVPPGMESLVLPGGLYAVFHYKGSSTDPGIFQYIYGTWLPASDYVLDDRPHFEVLGPKYKNNDPESEEEIWIPVRTKNQ